MQTQVGSRLIRGLAQHNRNLIAHQARVSTNRVNLPYTLQPLSWSHYSTLPNSSAAEAPTHIPAKNENTATTADSQAPVNDNTFAPNTSTTNTNSESNETEKIISVEELQRAAQKAQQYAETRKEMEQLLKTVIFRGSRALLLFIVAFSAFFYVVKQKGSESRIVRYLEGLRRSRGTDEPESEEEMTEQERALKEAMEKTEKLKREMKDSTWYMEDDEEPTKAAKKSTIHDNINTKAAKEQQQALIKK